MACFLTGYGAAHPERVVTNHELAPLLGVAPEWIAQNSGIRERRWAGDQDSTAGLASKAILEALVSARLDAAKLDYLIGSTLGAECVAPGIVPFVQRELPGCRRIPALDIRAGCIAFLQSLDLARGLLAAQSASTIACFASEIQSRHLRLSPESANLSMLFGDGAGAVIVSNRFPENPTVPVIEIQDILLGSDGTNAENLGFTNPQEGPRMNGRVVILHALKRFQETAAELLNRNNLSKNDISAVICHQPNINLLKMAAERLEIPFERFVVTLDRFGNTSGAAHFVALNEAVRQKRFKTGDRILMLAFGTGFAWGGAVGVAVSS